MALSVDVFVYDSRPDAVEWLRAFEADSDGPLQIGNVTAAHRVRGGVAEIAFMTGDVLAYSSAIAARNPTGTVPVEDAVRRAALVGAELLVRNIR
jgi:5-hydroxyisourate hydrolase-like protein (transthyretin family)